MLDVARDRQATFEQVIVPTYAPVFRA